MDKEIQSGETVVQTTVGPAIFPRWLHTATPQGKPQCGTTSKSAKCAKKGQGVLCLFCRLGIPYGQALTDEQRQWMDDHPYKEEA